MEQPEGLADKHGLEACLAASVMIEGASEEVGQQRRDPAPVCDARVLLKRRRHPPKPRSPCTDLTSADICYGDAGVDTLVRDADRRFAKCCCVLQEQAKPTSSAWSCFCLGQLQRSP